MDLLDYGSSDDDEDNNNDSTSVPAAPPAATSILKTKLPAPQTKTKKDYYKYE